MKIADKQQAHQDLRKTCLLNASVASNKLSDFKTTISKCKEVLYMDDKSAKAYFLKSKALAETKQYDEALLDIKEAIKLCPDDKAMRQ